MSSGLIDPFLLKEDIKNRSTAPALWATNQKQKDDIKQDQAKGVKEQNRTLCACNKRWHLEKTLWKS